MILFTLGIRGRLEMKEKKLTAYADFSEEVDFSKIKKIDVTFNKNDFFVINRLFYVMKKGLSLVCRELP